MRYCALLLAVLAVVANCQAFFQKRHGVMKLDKDNFEKKVVNRHNHITLVKFYSPKSKASKELKSEWIKTAEGLQALARVGAVDCLQNRDLCVSYGVKKMPHIVFFQSGKKGFTNYTKAKTSKHFINAAKEMFPKKLTTYTTKKNADKKFNKKNKKLPKVLFFKSKKETSLLARSMAFNFKGRLAFATVEKFERKINKKCGVKKWPKVGVVQIGDKDEDIAMFDGKMNAVELTIFLERFALPSKDEEDPSDYPEQLTDDSCMNFLCKAGGLCAVLVQSINPDKPAINQIKNELSILNEVENARTDGMFTFAWIDSVKQRDFVDKVFGLSPQEYPQLVVMSGTKKRFAVFIGSYQEKQISDFLVSVHKGKTKTVPMGLKELPALVGDTTRCKGMKREFRSAEPKNEIKPQTRGHRKDTVADVTATNFDTVVLKSRATFMVAFVAGKSDCPKCEEFQEEFAKSQKDLKNTVKFGVVDCGEEENEDLAKKYGVEKFPDIRVFAAGLKEDDADKADEYSQEKTAEAMTKFAKDQVDLLRENHIKRLDETTFSGWVREGPYHPRFMLFTAKSDIPALWKAVTTEYLDTEVGFAISTDGNRAFGKQFNVTSFPKLVFLQGMPPQTEEDKKTGNIGFNIRGIDKGGMKYEIMTEWMDQIATIWPLQKEQLMKTNPEGFPKEHRGDDDDDDDDEDAADKKKDKKKDKKNAGKKGKPKREL